MDLSKLPHDIVSFIRKFLSLHDVWRINDLDQKLKCIFEYSRMTRFPNYYEKLPQNRLWKKFDAGYLFSFYHRRQNEFLQYRIFMQNDRQFYTLMFYPQWTPQLFNNKQIEEIHNYIETLNFQNLLFNSNPYFTELIFYQSNDKFSGYYIHQSPRYIFNQLHTIVFKIKNDLKHLHRLK